MKRQTPPRHEPSEAEVNAFVRAHPDGGTIDEIAAALAVTRQRASQLCAGALRKAERELARRGFTPDDLL